MVADGAQAGAADQAGGLAGIRIRMYRVGFGDFFLMSLPMDGRPQHVLIDCGVHAADIHAMADALQQMKVDTGGRLALVIMTHRHADHISGFASGKDVFAGFTVEQVWMSWFEDRGSTAAMNVQARITAVAGQLHAALTARLQATGQPPGQQAQYLDMAANILGLGAGSSNAVALDVLHGFKTAGGGDTPVAYYRAGDPPDLPEGLAAAGLTAEILGPPTDLSLVAQMDNRAHQYLTSAGDNGLDAPSPVVAPFTATFLRADFQWPTRRDKPKWLEPLYTVGQIKAHLEASMPDALAATAQSADDAINNQSLVVLFRFKGKSLLFCGDAQWGNWANFLFGGPIGGGPHPALTAKSEDILSHLDFLKVGHHGSTNATPIDVVEALHQRCVAMCSTAIGAYGNPSKGTEVPRVPLLAALSSKTGGQLARSDQVAAGDAQPAPEAGDLNRRVFRAGPAGKFIDYNL